MEKDRAVVNSRQVGCDIGSSSTLGLKGNKFPLMAPGQGMRRLERCQSLSTVLEEERSMMIKERSKLIGEMVTRLRVEECRWWLLHEQQSLKGSISSYNEELNAVKPSYLRHVDKYHVY